MGYWLLRQFVVYCLLVSEYFVYCWERRDWKALRRPESILAMSVI